LAGCGLGFGACNRQAEALTPDMSAVGWLRGGWRVCEMGEGPRSGGESLGSGDADELAGGGVGVEVVDEGEEVGECVRQTKVAGFVVLPAELELAVDDVLFERYGVPAERHAGGAGLRVVVAAAAFGRDGDRGQRVGGVATQAERRTAGGEPDDRCVRQLYEQLDRYGVRTGEEPETTRREQIGESREIHAKFL
jgi:hypothetical protein